MAWINPPVAREYTPQEVGVLAGVSANYVQAEINRGHLQARCAPAGKAKRFYVTPTAARAFAARVAKHKAEQKGDV